MTKVKICGITNLEDARHAVECGADMLGFNFYRGSKRYIEPSAAAKIVTGLKGLNFEKVGVFVNAEIAEIAEIVKQVGLDAMQLHGDEDPGYVSRLDAKKEIIKAIRPRSVAEAYEAADFDCDAILVDGYSDEQYGGSGIKANWDHAQIAWVVARAGTIYLAGGLTPENVAEAIRTVEPYAVDVASGVESSPGKKDPAKVAAFIKAAKEAL